MPNICDNVIEIKGDNESLERLIAIVRSDDINFDFNNIIPEPSEIDFENKVVFSNTGEPINWYEWRMINWGTRSNSNIDNPPSIDQSDGFVEVSFGTAWSPALEITAELSIRFPNLTFNHRYEEPNMDFSGYAVYQAGQVLEEFYGDYDAYPVSEHLYYCDNCDEECPPDKFDFDRYLCKNCAENIVEE